MALNFQNLLRQREEHWLLASIDEHLRKTDTGRPPDYHFHPSAVSGVHAKACLRYLTYSLYERPRGKSISAKLQRIFDNGHDMHRRYQRLFEEMGMLVGAEVEVYRQFPPIKGSSDGILRKPFSEQLYVLELKTINSQGYRAILAPHPHHATQTNLYMGLLEIHRGVVLYENKDTQEFKVYEIEFDHEEWNTLLHRMAEAQGAYERRVLPPKIEEYSVCQTCPFLEICRGVLSSGSDYIGDLQASLDN